MSIPQIISNQEALRQVNGRNDEKYMNAGSDSSHDNSKSLSNKIENNIDKNARYKFMDNEEGLMSKRVNIVLENLSRQDHKSHLTDNN